MLLSMEMLLASVTFQLSVDDWPRSIDEGSAANAVTVGAAGGGGGAGCSLGGGGGGGGGAIGALVDERGGTVAAIVRAQESSFCLMDDTDKERKLAAWAAVLESLSNQRSALARLQWCQRALPVDGHALISHLQRA